MYKRQILTKTNYPIVVSQPYKINNKDICTGVDKVSCIVMVHTAPGHFVDVVLAGLRSGGLCLCHCTR
jgi:hypothetical protein